MTKPQVTAGRSCSDGGTIVQSGSPWPPGEVDRSQLDKSRYSLAAYILSIASTMSGAWARYCSFTAATRSSGIPCFASAIGPAIAARVSASPPSEIAFRTASAKRISSDVSETEPSFSRARCSTFSRHASGAVSGRIPAVAFSGHGRKRGTGYSHLPNCRISSGRSLRRSNEIRRPSRRFDSPRLRVFESRKCSASNGSMSGPDGCCFLVRRRGAGGMTFPPRQLRVWAPSRGSIRRSEGGGSCTMADPRPWDARRRGPCLRERRSVRDCPMSSCMTFGGPS